MSYVLKPNPTRDPDLSARYTLAADYVRSLIANVPPSDALREIRLKLAQDAAKKTAEEKRKQDEAAAAAAAAKKAAEEQAKRKQDDAERLRRQKEADEAARKAAEEAAAKKAEEERTRIPPGAVLPAKPSTPTITTPARKVFHAAFTLPANEPTWAAYVSGKKDAFPADFVEAYGDLIDSSDEIDMARLQAAVFAWATPAEDSETRRKALAFSQ